MMRNNNTKATKKFLIDEIKIVFKVTLDFA